MMIIIISKSKIYFSYEFCNFKEILFSYRTVSYTVTSTYNNLLIDKRRIVETNIVDL